MSKLWIWLRVGFLLFAVLVFGGCGGGGGGGSPAPTPTPTPTTVPSGTWNGTLEDTVGVMHTFSVTTSGASITAIRRDNVLQPVTGTITHRSGNIFGFTLSDGTVGGFFLNSAQTHAAFLDDEFNIGVVQLNGGSLPTFVYTDLTGSWSGVTVTIPSISFATFNTTNSSATCTMPQTCTSGVTTGTFTQANFNNLSGPSRGRWAGTFFRTSGSVTSGSMSAFLSIDRRFGATWACGSPINFPANCEFTAWSKL